MAIVKQPGTLVLLRHGESTWNLENLFTGWHDVPLSPMGDQEAVRSGHTMAEHGLWFDRHELSRTVSALAHRQLDPVQLRALRGQPPPAPAEPSRRKPSKPVAAAPAQKEKDPEHPEVVLTVRGVGYKAGPP